MTSRPRPRSWFPARSIARATAATTAAGLLALAGCTPAASTERGFGSRQVLPTRDPALSFRSFSPDAAGIYLARTVPGISPANGIAAPYDRSLLDFASDAERPIASGVMSASLLPGGPGQARALVIGHFPSDDVIPLDLSTAVGPLLTFVDEGDGSRVDISDVVDQFPSLGATRAEPIAVLRAVPAGTPGTTWVGAPDSLVPTPAGFPAVAGRDRVGFIGLLATADGNGESFERLPFADLSTPTELVPAVLGDHLVLTGDGVVVPSPDSAGTLKSASYGVFCPPATSSPATPAPLCLLLYDRTFFDMSTRGFVYFLDSGGEVELSGTAAGTSVNTVNIAADARGLFWPGATADGGLRVFSWAVGATTLGSCAIAGVPANPAATAANAWSPVSDAFAVVVEADDPDNQLTTAWTLVGGAAGAACQPLATGTTHVSQVLFSPDGSLLARLESDQISGASTVHLANADGTSDQVVATGSYFFQIQFLDNQRLLLWHTNPDGYSLSWLDLTSTPAAEHPITDRVNWATQASWVWLNSRWLLIGDATSAADNTFSVDLVDIQTGHSQIVSPGVIDFRVPWTTAPAGATDLPVAYEVKGRAASDQDGIWVAHLPLADFPP